jgi:hypothetical protein
MTFIPSVLSIIDNNNSGSFSAGSFTPVNWTDTTGYNVIYVTIQANATSNPGGIQIQFSDDQKTSTTYFSETYLTENSIYSKSFPIFKRYLKVNVNTSATGTITTRLDTNQAGPVGVINNQYSNTQSPEYDAFGKFRVSNPETLIDLKIPGPTGTIQYRENQLMLTFSSTGTYSVTTNPGYLTLSGTGIGKQTNQSQKYIIYQPGKSLLFLGSGIIQPSGTSSSNYKGRIGMFDDSDGLFFECDGTGSISVVRRNTSDNLISQDDWNIDKMDGTGNSGFSLEFTNTQLFVIDLEWLGVGRIRYGFYIFGKIYYCHQIDNVNQLTEPYMKTANLPVRFELQGTAGSDTVSIKQICASVISEGGYNPLGFPFSYALTTAISGVNNTNWFPILAISARNRVTGGVYKNQNIAPKSLELVDTTGNNATTAFRIRIFFSPTNITLAQTPPLDLTWAFISDYSLASYANNLPTTITPGTDFISTSSGNITVYQGYFGARSLVSFADISSVFNLFTRISSNVDNIADVIVVEVRRIISTGNIVASINWEEIY